ncbi:sugar-specific transcriptional regulator TrmB [Clostridium acetireducens DSM 10703]|jgi:sugar-specific transcriptional regulator TrmB|uniref:Sugar-specific transcriptional regulator TrmB n=1 Tax=Clostridium acetireducens DSM 10703 TaxID=1121290 RepID=A0A1E8EVA6_9CLOT|nr:helix-turn-helix domain-containing protein [Clostridium acetireducens]OFH99455.1 sugar-specific transcriptional regulator TrmB [Clostridium acetireducens DSM 10703]
MDYLIQLMKRFDFTEYETKAYVALLINGKMTGYEVSKQSGVPRSKIYNILETLTQKGVVLSTKTTNVIYHALPVDEFISNLDREKTNDLDKIKNLLQQFDARVESGPLWHITGYDKVMNKCKYLLKNAKNEVYMQIWKEDIDDELLNLLLKAERKFENFILILFCKDHLYDLPLKKYYKHGFEEAKLNEMGSRWISIVVDSNEIMFGSITNKNTADVVWTQNNDMVFLAKEYIIHDAYTAKILETLGDKAKDTLGVNLEEVRKIFK